MSRGSDILTALKTRLEKITVANGYGRTVKNVRLSKSAMDLDIPPPDCPVIEIYQEESIPEHGASGHWSVNLQIMLLLIDVKDATDLDMEDFLADVRACLYADDPNGSGNSGITLGGVVTSVKLGRTLYDLNLIEANRRCVMEWTIRSSGSTYKR